MSDLFQRIKAALADRYAIESLLGVGGMATVFLAQDLKHHRKVAVKVLQLDEAADVTGTRFLREIQVAATLNHPHILALHESGEADGLLYYVMPLVEGDSVRDRLARRDGSLPVDEALHITLEVADALSYAHGRDVVHRDIKPENILLADDHAYVADFGIAQAICADCGENLTVMGAAIGTPAYMSPEQAMGGEVDRRTDVYSLACVLYEMLTGKPPAEDQRKGIPISLTDAPLQWGRGVRPGVVGSLNDVLKKALALDTADRYSAVADFAEALKRATAPQKENRVRRRLVGAFVVVLFLASFGIWRLGVPRGGGVSPPGSIESVAVLPLVNLSGDPGEQFFVDGMTETLITNLVMAGGLSIPSRTSINRYRDTKKSVRKIARELNVDAVIEGSVLRAGDRVRIDAQLIEAATDRHLWANSYEWDLRDVLVLQREVARAIVEEIQSQLRNPTRLERLEKR